MYILLQILFPCKLLSKQDIKKKQDIEYSSLCYTVGSYWLSILYIVAAIAAQLCLTLCDPMVCPWNFLGKSNYWSGLSFPSPGDLPNPEIEPWFHALQADSLPSVLLVKPIFSSVYM